MASPLVEEGEVLRRVYDIIEKAKLFSKDLPEKVVEFLHPHEIQVRIQIPKSEVQIWEKFDFTLSQEGLGSIEELEEIVRKVMKYSVKTTHARFYNQFYSRMDEVGLAGAFLLEALNTNIHTYECAPVFVTMEILTIAELIKLFGWQEGDGIFVPGGSMSNIFGMALAKQWKNPKFKKEGLFGSKPLAVLTSDMCHYSMQKGASFLGIGEDNVYYVKSDQNGKISANSLKQTLERARADGKDPFFLNTMAGTTVFGAFDPIDELVDVCKQEGLWVHVDACWGGGVIMSPNTKHLMKGCERADSIAWNTHKMFGAPLQTTALLVHHKGFLGSCNSVGASYLFQPDKHYDVSYDTGDKSIQCGRKGDVLKIWLMFKFRGMKFYSDRIDDAMTAAKYLESSLRQRTGFRLVLEKHDWPNICFWYIPPSLRGQEENNEWKAKLHKVAPAIKKRFVEAGTLMVAFQPMPSKGIPNFFRMVFHCFPVKSKEDVDFIVNEIEKFGKDL